MVTMQWRLLLLLSLGIASPALAAPAPAPAPAAAPILARRSTLSPSPYELRMARHLANRDPKRKRGSGGPVTIPLRAERVPDFKPAKMNNFAVNGSLENVPIRGDNKYIHYYLDFDIGTPSQTLNVVMDTGSHSMVIYGADCQGCDLTEGHVGFDSAKSSSYVRLRREANAAYGGGEENNGTWATDTAYVGNWQIDAYRFQVVESSNAVSRGVSQTGDGIAGLGWNYQGDAAGNFDSSFTLLLALEWDDPEFGVYLGRIDPKEYMSLGFTVNSELTLGGVDATKIQGAMTYTEVLTDTRVGAPTMWAVEIQAAKMGDHAFPTASLGNAAALVDTGAPLIIAPPSFVAAWHGRIPGAVEQDSYWTVPCNSSNLNLTLTFAGVDFDVYWADLVSPVDATLETCVTMLTPNTVASRPYDWLLGDAFLRSVYSSYRYYPPSVGFAPLTPAAANQDNMLPGAALVGNVTAPPPPDIEPAGTGVTLAQPSATPDVRQNVSRADGPTAVKNDTSQPTESATSNKNGAAAQYSVGGVGVAVLVAASLLVV